MFPDRVKKMVLEGVVDAPNYIAQEWSTNLRGTDKVLQAFYKYSFDGGSRCPLCDTAGPVAIERSSIGFLKIVQQNPIVAMDNSRSLLPDILTYDDIKRFILLKFHSPVRSFLALASMLVQLQKGDYDQILRLRALQAYVHCPRGNGSTSPLLPSGTRQRKRLFA